MPDDPRRPRVFWDSSALITAVMSGKPYSAARQLLELGDLGLVDMRLCAEVVSDTEYIVGKRRPDLLPDVALTIHYANFAGETARPTSQTVEQCLELTAYRPDARVLACAIECDADIFVTGDREHFLDNPLIGPPRTRIRVMDPYHALEWVLSELRQQGQPESE
jgi:hypothetical protein